MKRGRLFFSVATFIVFLSSLAIANGLNLNSLGSRALAMGGAFVGLADDFSAIYWNPAGIAQFDKQCFGFYGTDIIPSGTYKFEMLVQGFGTITVVDAETVSKHYLAGMAAYYRPLSENIVAGIAVYVPAGLGQSWDGADFAAIAGYDPSLEWRSKIGLVTIAPAIAYRINDQFFVGASLNINYGVFDVAMHAGSTEIPLIFPPYYMEVDLGQYEENMKGWGYGATFGILVKPSEMFSLGATFRTSSKVEYSGDASISGLSTLGSILGASLNSTSDLERVITWPMWIAGGVAFKPMENLTLTADVQYTQWSKIDVMETDYKDSFWRFLMTKEGDDKRPMHWDDAVQIRFGAEYKINTIAIRGGYYYDPSPAPDRTMNVLLPNYDFNVFTLGFGYNLNGLQVDFSFEYLTGKERDIPFGKTQEEFPEYDPEWKTAMPGVYNMNIVVPNISISYKF